MERFSYKGTIGLVKRCTKVETGEEFAVKIIKSRDDEMLENIKNEFRHLQNLVHENIVKMHELLIDTKIGEIFLVMEYFRGKELFVMLSEIGHYNGFLTRRNCETPVYATPQRD